MRERVDAADLALARLTAAVIAEDTGLSDEEAMLLASGMQGMVQVAARRWLRDDRPPSAARRPPTSSAGSRGAASAGSRSPIPRTANRRPPPTAGRPSVTR